MIPPPLKTGDTIGYFSPSLPATVFAPTRLERAKQFLESKGFSVRAGSLTGKSDHYRSGTIQDRADELNELIRDPKVRCVISTIGGFNSNSLLPYIDYEALQADPKIIVGYSDMTAILLAIYQRTGIITYYGPALVASLGEIEPLVGQMFESFITTTGIPAGTTQIVKTPARWTDQFIEWGTPEYASLTKETHPNNTQWVGTGRVSGRLIGGNVDTLWGISDTPYMPTITHNDILLIEDSLLSIRDVEKSFAWLKIRGVFSTVKAVIMGRHEGFKDLGTGRSSYDILKEVLNGEEVPIVVDFDCSHTLPLVTLPLGAKITVDFDNQALEIHH